MLALQEISRRKPLLKNRVAPEIVVPSWRAARQAGGEISEVEVREALERRLAARATSEHVFVVERQVRRRRRSRRARRGLRCVQQRHRG